MVKKVSFLFLIKIPFYDLNVFTFLNNKNLLFESYRIFIHIMIYISLFKHLIRKSSLFWHFNRHLFSCKWQLEIPIDFICCIYTMIQIRCYYLITYFISSIIFSNTISSGLICITGKKVSLFCLWSIFFHNSIFFNNIKSLYESYWAFIYIVFYSFFQTYDLEFKSFLPLKPSSLQL